MEEVMPKAEATLKYARISSRKVKIVADLIRGKKIDEALAIVKYVPKASSEIIEKLLKSAIANAENNHHMAHEKLYVAEIYANQGPTLKRIRPAAKLVAENIAKQLKRRISFRRGMKQCMQKALKDGALGIKTAVSGRLGGADMARTEFYKEGNIPLQTLRADIDYGFAEADTTYGKIGVKVWIYKGEVLPERPVEGGDQ